MTNKLVAGNWKLNGSLAANAALLDALTSAPVPGAVSRAVCVPYPYLAQAQQMLAGSSIALGAQDVCEHDAGAYTGEVSAPMLAEFGCRYVIVGHSERRAMFAEDDALVGRKAAAALAGGLVPIVCVGETLAERDGGAAIAVIRRQLDAVAAALDARLPGIVIAYEPVWAIGTGRSASTEQVGEVHSAIRGWLRERCGAAAQGVKILYGGSVKPGNARELFSVADVDGGLIGGASLLAQDFNDICRSAADVQS